MMELRDASNAALWKRPRRRRRRSPNMRRNLTPLIPRIGGRAAPGGPRASAGPSGGSFRPARGAPSARPLPVAGKNRAGSNLSAAAAPVAPRRCLPPYEWNNFLSGVYGLRFFEAPS